MSAVTDGPPPGQTSVNDLLGESVLKVAESVVSLRIVVRPHLNRTVVDQLAKDVIEACDYLKENGGNAKPPELHKHTAPKC